MAARIAHSNLVGRVATEDGGPTRLLRKLLRRLHSRPTAEQEADQMDDPLAHLTVALKQLLQRQAKLDQLEIETQDPWQRERITRWQETNLRAIEHLEEAIAATPARGKHEAVVQVMVAAGRIQQLAGETPEEKLERDLDAARLLLRSALPVLARAVGVDLAAFGAAHYAQSRADSPFFHEDAVEPDAASEE